ncbi:hypothetical protein AQUCO_04500215v1 [Aquilegia coerulea]|uniref:Non-specific lipid-transfer protein n=1 Tax=Aquilegia coerulea TaxID=218851 RepID=A0A2G5CMD7_AQUCA|nr:hypothetical protein AQUCO_04500215v1 [Aquilegia coerulea]
MKIHPVKGDRRVVVDSISLVDRLGPCINYLRAVGPLSPECCRGVSSLNRAAETTSDRQTACRCLKSANRRIPGLNQGAASSLPGKCNVNIGYPISPSVDCSKVK